MLDAHNRNHAASVDVMDRQRARPGEVIAGTRSEVEGRESQLDLSQIRADVDGLRPHHLRLDADTVDADSKRVEVASAERSSAEAKAGIARLAQTDLQGIAGRQKAAIELLSLPRNIRRLYRGGINLSPTA